MHFNFNRKASPSTAGAPGAGQPPRAADDDRTDPLGSVKGPAHSVREWLATVHGVVEEICVARADGTPAQFFRLTLFDPDLAAAVHDALLDLPEQATGFRDLLVHDSAPLCAALDAPEATLAQWLVGAPDAPGLRPIELLEGIRSVAQVLDRLAGRSGFVWPAPDAQWLGLHAVIACTDAAGPAAQQLRFLAWPQLAPGAQHVAARALVELALQVWREFRSRCETSGFILGLPSLRAWEDRLIALAADPGLDYAAIYHRLAPEAVPWALCGATDPGMRREHNEDAYLSLRLDQHSASGSRLTLAAIADGMGGHASGEVASSLALDLLRQQLSQLLIPPRTALCDPQALPAELGRLIPAIDSALAERARMDPALAGMGTTLCGFAELCVQSTLVAPGSPLPGRSVVFWVGDSRAYLLGPAGLQPLSTDHSFVQALLKAGEIKPEDAFDHPHKNVITRCLGGNGGEALPDMFDFKPGPGELLLLCSDGLSDALHDAEIWRTACQNKAATPELLAAMLIANANTAGGPDNITVVIVN